jgi:glycerol-3-phosphate acyltransferase PlsY
MVFLVVALSYLIGSIPTAYIAGRCLSSKDIRRLGDSNVGAANAYRELGALTGVAVGIFDAAKGALAIYIAQKFSLPQVQVLVAGTAAVLGHNFPAFLGFRGGRGVSTSIGVLVSTVTLPILILAVTTIITLLITRNVTKSMVVMFVPLSGLSWWLGFSGLLIGFSIFLPCIVGLTHLFRTRHMPARLSP